MQGRCGPARQGGQDWSRHALTLHSLAIILADLHKSRLITHKRAQPDITKQDKKDKISMAFLSSSQAEKWRPPLNVQ